MTFERPIDVATTVDGGGEPAPADRIRRLAESPWALVLLRALGVLGVMTALAVIGIVSMSKSFAGTTLEGGVLAAELGSAWIVSAKPGPRAAASAVDDASAAQTACEKADGGGAQSPGVTADGKVILNTAGVADLTRLPGVGQRRAQDIIALRKRLKKFRRLTDLLRVKGIGARSLRRMQPHLVLDPPASEAGDGGTRPDGG